MSNDNDQLLQLCERARDAKYAVQQLGTDKKNAALRLVADKLVEATDRIIEANKIDYKASEDKGVSPALLDRLMLNKERIEAMAEGVRQVADLPDPVGEILEEFERPNGLKFKKVRVPLGVIGIIYESRPNVTADAFALTFKSGNAVILKGGSDAINSNIAIVEAIQEYLNGKSSKESIANRLGVKKITLETWIDKYKLLGSEGFIHGKNRHYSKEFKEFK